MEDEGKRLCADDNDTMRVLPQVVYGCADCRVSITQDFVVHSAILYNGKIK